ncbi:MAG TPA: L,D-transpeptidase [Thermoanaerobaculia bacterium]|nr:L,D-transpeptidase [Thermoanaerobaculia bacterium]
MPVKLGKAIVLVLLLATATALAEPTKKKSRRRAPARKPAVSFDVSAVNDPATATPIRRGSSGSVVVRAQVLLDRAHFSPGEIDGSFGSTMTITAAGFQRARGMTGSGTIDEATWKVLNADSAPALVRYGIRPEDVAGPFLEIPEDMMEKATLPALGYSSPLELLSEKFHVSPKLLSRLNPGKSFEKAGEEILVPNVRTAGAGQKAAKIVVDKTASTVTALDAENKPIAQYPATMGSEHDPLPIGDWKVNGVSRNPPFHYNPDLFWDADAKDEKATIKPGPNNPVGVVWIDLSKQHYGIHGTPEPSTIGKTQSHGCIRLTNWDAQELAEVVGPGTPAVLKE